jgi:hypothetical protein
MKHFFPRLTTMANIWCNRCHRETPHTISGGRPLHCDVCYAKLKTTAAAAPPPPKPGNLFD